MILYNILTEDERNLLNDIDIQIDHHNYSDDELDEIMDRVQDKEVFEVYTMMDEGKTYSQNEENYAHLNDRLILITDSVYTAIEKAKKKRKEDFVADRIGENEKYLIVSMTNSNITDGFDRPWLIVNKELRKEILTVPLFDYPEPPKYFEDLNVKDLVWKEI